MRERYFLKFHDVREADSASWYELLERVRDFPLAMKTTRHVAVFHSKATAEIVVSELNKTYLDGVIAGMTRFAWWRDGQEMVGTCGTTLKQATEDLCKEKSDAEA